MLYKITKNEPREQVLEADPDEVLTFLNAVFRRCKVGEGNYALRAFEHSADGRCVLRRAVPFDGKIKGVLIEAANEIAARSAPSAVLSPPVCIFGNETRDGKSTATERNVLAAPAIVVDLDKAPRAGLEAARSVLGPPTLVVETGGLWAAPDGVQQPKLHVYWRLKSPATSDQEKIDLKRARRLAALISGGDRTAAALSHPLRLPGSWHTKGEPRPCRVVENNGEAEVELTAALELLQAEADAQGLKVENSRHADGRTGFKAETPLCRDDLLALAAAIPNPDAPDWNNWSNIGMAFYDASHGSDDGEDAFYAWSEKAASVHDLETAQYKWDHIRQYPPSNISTGTLVRLASRAQLGFQLPSGATIHEERRAEDFFDPVAGNPDAVGADGQEWPEPLDIFGHEDPASLSEPPQGALPEIIARWARSEARRKGVPLTFAAASAMTAVAAAIGGSLRIRPRVHDDGWTEPAAFWTALVADPGGAKSPTISAAVQPLRELDKERWKLDKPRHDEWLAASRRRGKDAPPPGAEPAIRRCVVDDITMEQQVRIHAANPRGLLRAPDELAGLLGSLGAYKKGADADRSQLLRLFDGGEITIDRVGSGTTRADSSLMTVLAGTQPDKIRSLTRDLGADGLLQRCIFVLDDGADRVGIDEPADGQALADYRHLVRHLAQAEYLPLTVVRASPDAQAVIVGAWRRISALQHLPGASGALQGHIAKWEKLLWRIALVFHCVNEFRRAGCVDCDIPVSMETARQAARFAGHLVQHSIEFYRRNYDASTTNTEAVGIAGWLLTRPDISTVTRRDIQQARKSLAGADNVRQLLKAMEELVIAGWCKEEARRVDGGTKWSVNPAAHERFIGRAQREKEERKRKHELIKEAGAARRALAEALELNSARGLNEGAFA
ncbi:DUF3987 domain-containing protein [Labrys sp. LIt4]|uniref:DUF3987 domain-containing protein n=1 Tax=Labrys sp. LIt4 TaxID=2821355 RepID=UPI001AE0D9ED|nr:DUF3987 domain-containing protein [Labrys sp. LIt4]MBP0581489.1 DUF3987 domain-containing protein [Labrys sp. LIt4]